MTIHMRGREEYDTEVYATGAGHICIEQRENFYNFNQRVYLTPMQVLKLLSSASALLDEVKGIESQPPGDDDD